MRNASCIIGGGYVGVKAKLHTPRALTLALLQRYDVVVVYYIIGDLHMVIELEDFITIREAARECHRSAETVRRWVWDGKLHAEKLGNQLFVRRADLDRLRQRSAADKRAARLAALDKLDELRERIRQHGGAFNVVEDLERSRESHPHVGSSGSDR